MMNYLQNMVIKKLYPFMMNDPIQYNDKGI